jgi:hypothetical protein
MGTQSVAQIICCFGDSYNLGWNLNGTLPWQIRQEAAIMKGEEFLWPDRAQLAYVPLIV